MSPPEELLQTCRDTLASLELDASGTASSTDLRRALQGPSGPVPEGIWDDLFEHMDVDGDGRVSLAELVAAMAGLIGPHIRTPTHRLTFDLFDQNGDGYLSLDELQTALRAIGRTPANIQATLAHADLDGDGRLEYVEFLHLLGG